MLLHLGCHGFELAARSLHLYQDMMMSPAFPFFLYFISVLIITSGCLGALVCLLLLLFAGYLIGKRLRRKTHGKDGIV